MSEKCQHVPVTELRHYLMSSTISPGKVGWSFFGDEWFCQKCGVALKAHWSEWAQPSEQQRIDFLEQENKKLYDDWLKLNGELWELEQKVIRYAQLKADSETEKVPKPHGKWMSWEEIADIGDQYRDRIASLEVKLNDMDTRFAIAFETLLNVEAICSGKPELARGFLPVAGTVAEITREAVQKLRGGK